MLFRHIARCANGMFRLIDVRLSRLPSGSLPDWPKPDIMCKKPIDHCKSAGKSERFQVSAIIETGAKALSVVGRAVDWETVKEGCDVPWRFACQTDETQVGETICLVLEVVLVIES